MLEKAIPGFATWLSGKYTNDLTHARPEVPSSLVVVVVVEETHTHTLQVQAQVHKMEEAAKKGQKLSHKDKRTPTDHLHYGWRNMHSSLSNFFRFLQLYEGNHLPTHSHTHTDLWHG